VDGLVDWYHGTTGYDNALAGAKKKETPLIMFFYLELDSYCQKLGNVYFSAYDVYSYLEDIPKVDINLGGNEFELELARKFDVNIDPTLLISFPFSDLDPVKITPYLENKEMTPQEFVSTLRNVFSLSYNKIAFSFLENQEYDKAIKYYKSSIKYDPDRAYTYFALASVYHTKAVEEKNPEYLKNAEVYYLKALKLDTEFKECKEELEKLYENMKIMGVAGQEGGAESGKELKAVQ
jgi:tetratricopeptide (TPR) repeat protein